MDPDVTNINHNNVEKSFTRIIVNVTEIEMSKVASKRLLPLCASKALRGCGKIEIFCAYQTDVNLIDNGQVE